jgi:hypothetical protein
MFKSFAKTEGKVMRPAGQLKFLLLASAFSLGFSIAAFAESPSVAECARKAEDTKHTPHWHAFAQSDPDADGNFTCYWSFAVPTKEKAIHDAVYGCERKVRVIVPRWGVPDTCKLVFVE